MKPILLNINEMSDSREVYESKPNKVLTIFIYVILAMLTTAVIWMYFGRIDMVVKSEGMIRPNNQVATIVNTRGGVIENVNVEDGKTVEEGDILYVIEHKDLNRDLKFYKDQLSDVEKTLKLLEKYKKSVVDGVNYFKNNSAEEEYYLKFEGYYINYQMSEKNTNYDTKTRELNLDAVTKQYQSQNEKLNYLNRLKEAINKNTNGFKNQGKEKEYYNLYEKYQSDYLTIVNQYKSAKAEIDNSTSEEGLINSMDYYNGKLEGLNTLKASIDSESNLFDGTNSYSLQYEEYLSKLEELTAAYGQVQENYEINQKLSGLAVTEWEVEQSELAVDEAERAVKSYKSGFMEDIITNITEVEKNLKELKLSKANTLTKDELYTRYESERSNAINNFQLNYMVDLDNKINTLEESADNLNQNINNLKLEEDKAYHTGKEEGDREGNLAEYRNTEIQTTLSGIKSYTDQQTELKTNLSKIQSEINEAVVKATKSGVINSNVELVKGDTLAAGTEVLTIIPGHNSRYKVNIYVSNQDIGKLNEGMKAKFNVYALPNSEYGYLTGTVAKISKDLKVDTNNSSGYYLVEADLDNKALYDSRGEKAELKAGMACQAQMITENKRILSYVLEKLDLWMD